MGNWGSDVDEFAGRALARRSVLGGVLAAGALGLAGCATLGRPSQIDVIERMLMLSSQRAFARLTQPDGFWDSTVARIELPILFGKPGSRMARVLKGPVFRERLQRELNRMAEDAARLSAPLVYDAVRGLTVSDALALLRGGDTAATTYLRQSMGPMLVNAMIPELSEIMQATEDPLLNQALSALAGVDVADAAHALALEADNAIWYEIGAQEAEIRRNPETTNDPMLIAALKAL